MEFQSSYNKIENITESVLAQMENKDCTVRAIASACGVSYDEAHAFCKNKLNRPNRKGIAMDRALSMLEEKEVEVGDKKFRFVKLKEDRVRSKYVAKKTGKVTICKARIPAFIKQNPVGTFITLVSSHAFTISNGIVYDNPSFEFKTMRMIKDAYEVIEVPTSTETVDVIQEIEPVKKVVAPRKKPAAKKK